MNPGRHPLIRAASILLFTGALCAGFAASAAAQTQVECSNLAPLGIGQDDWPRINNCLVFYNQVTLGYGTFYISQPITFPASFASLIGSGRANTSVIAQFNCSSFGAVIDANGQGRTLDYITIRNFYLDLTNCGTGASDAVRFLRSNNGEVSGMTIATDGTGGSSLSGVHLVKADNILVSGNRIRDFTGGAGVVADDSGSARIDNNRVIRTDFGIIVRNNAGVGSFDSSNSQVTNNTITDSFGRAMKLQASDAGSLLLRNVVVTGNTATGFGTTGLYLVANVTKARIESNSFTGGANAFYGLWVGSINPGQVNPGLNASFDNKIDFNFFQGGSRGADVSFNGSPNVAGPDQPTISRGSAGTNTLGRGLIEKTPSNRCSQYAHAWFDYLFGLNYVFSGGQILLAAAGTRSGSRVTYHFRQNGVEVATRTTLGATASNCVLNQETYTVNLPPGLYDVFVDLRDGNARYPNAETDPGVPINNWQLGIRLDVR